MYAEDQKRTAGDVEGTHTFTLRQKILLIVRWDPKHLFRANGDAFAAGDAFQVVNIQGIKADRLFRTGGGANAAGDAFGLVVNGVVAAV